MFLNKQASNSVVHEPTTKRNLEVGNLFDPLRSKFKQNCETVEMNGASFPHILEVGIGVPEMPPEGQCVYLPAAR